MGAGETPPCEIHDNRRSLALVVTAYESEPASRDGDDVSARRPEVAILGAGLMGQWHARYATAEGARVVAVIDPDEARAQALARDLAATRVFRTLDGLPGGHHRVRRARLRRTAITAPSPTAC